MPDTPTSREQIANLVSGRPPHGSRCQSGVSLIELLLAVTIVAVLAAVVLPRITPQASQSKSTACQVSKGNIEVQAQLWFRNKGNWPAADLNDIGSDASYFPSGLPTCPVDGSSYGFDSATESVVGHDH